MRAPPLRIPRSPGQHAFKSSPRIVRSSQSLRAFSQTASRAQRPDPRHNPQHVDYDASLGDPWYHYRLRNAKPLFAARPPPNPHPTAADEPSDAKQDRDGFLEFLRTTKTRIFIAVSMVLGTFFFWYNTEVVPVSGRRRFNHISDNAILSRSEAWYHRRLDALRREGKVLLPVHDARVRRVTRVMNRLIPVAGPLGNGVTEWAVHVIYSPDARTANAFVIPGGKVFVYSSLLRVAQTDDQLAAVLSHEIAHNLARHQGERSSLGTGKFLFLGSTFMLLLPSGWKYWLFGTWAVDTALRLMFENPMSRIQETEADYIGMMLMAEACYDPRGAIELWRRFAKMKAALRAEPMEWMSTHPSSGHRIERFDKWLPEALDKRKKSDCKGTQGFADAIRRAMDRGEVFVRRI